MHVIVAGGTGFIGRRLCHELLDRGHEVTALGRNPEPATLPEEADTLAIDVTDPSEVEARLPTAETLVNLVALSPLYQPSGGDRRHFEVHLEGTKTLLEVAEQREITRFCQMSGLGASVEAQSSYLKSKGAAEQAVQQSELETVILRPSVVFGEGDELVDFLRLLTTPYLTILPSGGSTRFQPIWVNDVAELVAEAAIEERHGDNTYEFGGPEPLTLAELTKTFYAVVGKPVRIIPLPMGLARIGLTLLGPIPVIPFGPDQYWGLQLDNTPSPNAIDAFDVSPESLTTFEEQLRERFGP